MFILASSVCKSLQCLISALIQWGEAIYLGSLFQLCFGDRGTPQTNITGVCGECSRCLSHTGFAFAHSMCAFPVYTAQAPGCSAGEVSKASPGLHALPGSEPLRFRFSGTPQRHRMGLSFAPFPGPSSSSDQVLCERALPGMQCILSPPQSQWLGFLGAPPERHLRFAVCLLWGADL